MNQKGTHSETPSHVPLTSVQSGNMCRLIGVSDARPSVGRHGKQRGWFGRREKHYGYFSKHLDKEWHNHDHRQIMKRLLDLGLTKGCTFIVVQGRGQGPVLVEVRGTRIALGHGLASKVIVEVLGEKR
ncbi:MAG: ferrous iron transport protein A [Candidatus Thorarchaeota archaeon]